MQPEGRVSKTSRKAFSGPPQSKTTAENEQKKQQLLGEHYCSDHFNFDLLRSEIFEAPTFPYPRGRHGSNCRVENGEHNASFVPYPFGGEQVSH